MPLPLRRYYTELMVKSKNAEKEEIDKLHNNQSTFKNPPS